MWFLDFEKAQPQQLAFISWDELNEQWIFELSAFH